MDHVHSRLFRIMVLGVRSSSSTASSKTDPAIELKDDEKYMTALDEYFHRRSEVAPAAADYVLYNALKRTYPLHRTKSLSPCAPIPEKEATRLECIDKFGLMDLREPMLELDVISSFLSREFDFQCVMITITGKKHLLVLGSSVVELVQVFLPREQTFANTYSWTMLLSSSETQKLTFGSTIWILLLFKARSSICCIHTTPLDITRLQYNTLKRFGEIASQIIQINAEARMQSL
ncbi:GAF domain containing hypothetical protein [Phytophthora palmivora]|uniref:Uncharacterized protein n=1 Tax=Phytophthora palmivora TaxID=4796 RepID=A0A2P4YSD1_9STRA|nr:GAF domain containing hypothetical protein [Phytophthora palmivora]